MNARPIALFLAAFLPAACSPAISTIGIPAAESNKITQTGPIVTLVKVKTPWYAPEALVVKKMREEVPTYLNLSGLNIKYFTLGKDGTYGGIYLWKDRNAAQAWFNDDWFAGVLARRGTAGDVRYFEAPVVLDNSARVALPPDNSGYATLVTLPIPQGMSRDAIIAEFHKSLPTYRKVPGLVRKYFILTPDGLFGGIYLWQDRQSADVFYSPEWHARVRAAYNVDARLETFDVPIAVKTNLPVLTISND